MKDNLHEVDQTQRSDGFWIWLGSDEQEKESTTYFSRLDTATSLMRVAV